jgi:serine/threonine-protein kinase
MSVHALVNDDPPLDVPPPGAVLAGAYRVEARLGKGGMGVVLRATELSADRLVAIKVMTAVAAADPEQVARFRREAKAASSLTSKHVVRVLDFGELESGLPYLVMEHLEGMSLVELCKERGPLPVAEAVEYVMQAIHGVAEAHALGIVHRDLKPANLFLTGELSAPVVKVLDFGASKLTPESTVDPSDPGGVTVASSLIGSPRYMAPEQIRSALEVDARADVYALGATLHELLSGKPIFFADSLARIFAQVLWDAPEPLAATRDDVPSALVAIVSRCLAKAPGDRYATVEALAAALAPFGRSGSVSAPTATATPKARPPAPKPAAASGSKLVAARLFKPEESVTKADAQKTTVSASKTTMSNANANASEPKPRRPISASKASVVLKATARMPRMKLASEPPKRTVKIAAFALAARLAPGVVAVPSPAADAIARGVRTARMVRFDATKGALPRRAFPRWVAMGAALAAVVAFLAVFAVARQHARRPARATSTPGAIAK